MTPILMLIIQRIPLILILIIQITLTILTFNLQFKELIKKGLIPLICIWLMMLELGYFSTASRVIIDNKKNMNKNYISRWEAKEIKDLSKIGYKEDFFEAWGYEDDSYYVDYYSNGNLKSIESYMGNVRHGKSLYFNENGELVKERKFYYNPIIDTLGTTYCVLEYSYNYKSSKGEKIKERYNIQALSDSEKYGAPIRESAFYLEGSKGIQRIYIDFWYLSLTSLCLFFYSIIMSLILKVIIINPIKKSSSSNSVKGSTIFILTFLINTFSFPIYIILGVMFYYTVV